LIVLAGFQSVGVCGGYRTHGDSLWPRFTGGKSGTLWYYRELETAFAKAGKSELAAELDRVISEIKNLSEGEKPNHKR
jgi:GTP pyrophosphokinase